MRLLFLMENLYPLIGGAEKSIDTLIRALHGRSDFRVDFLCKSELNQVERGVSSLVQQSDIVLTQLRWANLAVRTARACQKKSVLFVRSYENVCDAANDGRFLAQCGQACRTCDHRKLDPPRADLIIANSKYMANFLKEEHGLDSEVVYPFIDPVQVKAEPRERVFITMDQLSAHKGAEIFLKVAMLLPKYRFRIVGYQTIHSDLKIPPNVTLTGPLPPKEFYSDTLLFLAPALWKEPFGRTIVESQINGIPIIASAQGAAREDGLLPEELLVEDFRDPQAWRERIEMVLENYQHFVERVERFDFQKYQLETNIDRFCSLLQDLHAKGEA